MVEIVCGWVTGLIDQLSPSARRVLVEILNHFPFGIIFIVTLREEGVG